MAISRWPHRLCTLDVLTQLALEGAEGAQGRAPAFPGVLGLGALRFRLPVAPPDLCGVDFLVIRSRTLYPKGPGFRLQERLLQK